MKQEARGRVASIEDGHRWIAGPRGRPAAPIPVSRPCLGAREAQLVSDAMRGGHLHGDGPYTARCRALLEREHGSSAALLTPSCTHALEMAALLLAISPGDEVIVPSFTFVSTANAFVLRGARPVFADVRPDTLNLDPQQVEHLVTERTRAIVPMHYAGVGCDMDRLLDIAGRCRAAVVEDNAHGLFGAYQGRLLGTFGAVSALSFHDTKNFTCGEGGALLINDAALVERAEILREKGTDRSRFFRGQVDKYTWVDVGSSYLPSDVLAAMLYGQLEARDRIQALRRALFERYQEALGDWATANGVRLPVVPPHCTPAYHLYYVLLPSLAARTAMIAHLGERGISSAFHYVPLHTSPMGQRFGGQPGQCPVTEDASARLLRLPFYNDLSAADQNYVIDAVRGFACG